MTSSATVMARLETVTAETPTRIAIPSDLHLTLDQHGTWRSSHRTAERLRAAVQDWNGRDLDAVVFIGDLVSDGARSQFDAFDRIIADLDHPFYAIPGNHDLIQRDGVDSLGLPEFERRYTPGGHPYHERIGGVDLLAVNSNSSTDTTIADTYAGELSEATQSWLAERLSAVDHPLVVVHHNLPGVRALHDRSIQQLEVSGGSPGFENADAVLETLGDAGSPLVLTGHLHFPAIVTEQSVTEFTLPSLGPYPCGYTIFEIGQRGAVATFHSVADYDERIEAFVLAAEHTRAQLAAAQFTGFPLRDDFGAP